ncbi:MAG TPA: signal peptidase I [Bryobacteraceae bacterium]|nr:signal peptidase I [Bryobacteraceae bacterium]
MTDAETVPESTPAAAQRSILRSLFAWLRDLSLSVAIAIVVILFLYQPVKVEGTSMMPGLQDQERIFINKFVYRLGVDDIARGDTVVFWFPNDVSKSYIKRVIGIPGDRVEIVQGQVFLNGSPLKEVYVPPQYRDQQSMDAKLVPPGDYFVLGDHRSSSNDSRAWGMVPRQNIYGKAVFIYWPLDKMGPLH